MKLKHLLFLVSSFITLSLLFSCEKSDNSEDSETEFKDEDGGIKSICHRVGESPEDYEWMPTHYGDEYSVIAGYKKETDIVVSWYWDMKTNEINRYTLKIPRKINLDLGYGESIIVNVTPDLSKLKCVLDIEGNHVLDMKIRYDHYDPYNYDYIYIHRIIMLMPDNISKELIETKTGKWGKDPIVEKWYNNTFAIAAVEEPTEGTTIFSSQGKKVTSFQYSISCMSDEIRSRIIEFYDYDKAVVFRKRYPDKEGRYEIVIDFVDLSKSTSYNSMISVKNASFRSPISGKDDKTKYTVEVEESRFDYCIVRMTLTEYSGEKNSFRFKVDKVNCKVELL